MVSPSSTTRVRQEWRSHSRCLIIRGRRARAAWARLVGRQTCVVHGAANPRNIRMTADRIAMIDWDESHVDVPDLDLALPDNAAGLDKGAYDIAA